MDNMFSLFYSLVKYNQYIYMYHDVETCKRSGVRAVVFNATFNNISFISWRSVKYWWRNRRSVHNVFR